MINSREILEKVEQYLSDNLVEAPETDNPAYSSLEVDKNNRRLLKKNWCLAYKYRVSAEPSPLRCAQAGDISERKSVFGICEVLESAVRRNDDQPGGTAHQL